VAHAIWRGVISFGLVTIPVELFSAVSKNEIAFHLLDSRDMAPVRNRRVNGITGEEVPREAVVKGYELPDGRWVTMTDEDFSAANVRATRTIDVLGAVCEDEVPDEYFDTPYYLAPETAGRKAYALLREALRKAGRIAVAQIVVRSRQRLCALVPHGDALMLVVMRYTHELRSASDLDLPGSDLAAIGVTEAEVALAAQLVATIQTDWDPARYRDSYRDDILALIARKAEGALPVPQPVEAEAAGAEVIDIMELLKRSIEVARSSGQGGR
jgi:DNA end-binding protein Ku